MKPQLLILSSTAALAAAQRAGDLPRIKLPYGTWQAAKHDKANDIYVFKNIRFGAPPVGSLRWAKPAAPAPEPGLQTGRKGPSCLSTISSSLMAMGEGFGSGGKGGSKANGQSPLGKGGKGGKGKGGLGGMLGDLDVSSLMNKVSGASEDCLFLDVYVPGKALKPGAAKLPVVNWIYGGAYLIGDKNYDGAAVVKASGNNVVYVAGNYRLGLFGWLAGDTVEKQGMPNAGLWDQRAVLEWIQQHIGLFGGDPAEVSVWGESAGAGSITHHLVAMGGKAPGPALFKRAVVMSPAYDYHVERKGHLERQYKEFAEYAGCAGKGLACLRGAPIDVLVKAQKKQLDAIPGGKPGVGPAADGVFVRQAAPLEFAAGNVVPGVESIILSHTLDEGKIFVPADTSEKAFEAVINLFWAGSKETLDAVRKQYPASKFPSSRERFRQLYNHGTFLCATRYIAEAYKGKVYNMVYSQGAGTHGADIAAAFYSGNPLAKLLRPGFAKVASNYQSYLVSHARTGDPNKYRGAAGTIDWPKVTYGPIFSNVLNVTDNGFALIKDEGNTEADCGFWTKALRGLTKAEGALS